MPTPKANRNARLKALHSLLDMLENDEQFLAAKTLSRPHRDGMGYHHDTPVTGAIPKLYAQLLVGALIRTLNAGRRVPQSIKRARALGIAVFPKDPAPARERKRLPQPPMRATVRRNRGDGDEIEAII